MFFGMRARPFLLTDEMLMHELLACKRVFRPYHRSLQAEPELPSRLPQACCRDAEILSSLIDDVRIYNRAVKPRQISLRLRIRGRQIETIVSPVSYGRRHPTGVVESIVRQLRFVESGRAAGEGTFAVDRT